MSHGLRRFGPSIGRSVGLERSHHMQLGQMTNDVVPKARFRHPKEARKRERKGSPQDCPFFPSTMGY